MPAISRPPPELEPEFCKGCLRCVDVCPRGCLQPGGTISPATGIAPVQLDPTNCNGCALCIQACPEPYGLRLAGPADTAVPARPVVSPHAPAETLPLADAGPLVLKGTYAAALGGLIAGCRHVFGYPITPSTEGAELMAKLLPKVGGSFVQAVSETAAVNMMYGAGGAGVPAMTFTSGPGFSLMLEGVSYMIGAEVPGVFVNVMRGGPGLGNVAPEQTDIKLACRGLGHGNTHAIVLAPSTPQEMLDLTIAAFTLSFRYRNPVVILGDGFLGQMTGRVVLPAAMQRPGRPDWAVCGDSAHRANVIASIHMTEADLEAHNRHLNDKYAAMTRDEQRADLFCCADADTLVLACNTPARMAKGAVAAARQRGVAAGLFRPVTLWPFPVDLLRPLLGRVRRLVVVECGPGQLEDELRLALSHAGIAPPPISSVRHYGGILPTEAEILAAVTPAEEMSP